MTGEDAPRLRIYGVYARCVNSCHRVKSALETPSYELAQMQDKVNEHVKTLLAWGPEHGATELPHRRYSLDDQMIQNSAMTDKLTKAIDDITTSLNDAFLLASPHDIELPLYRDLHNVDTIVPRLERGMKELSAITATFSEFYCCTCRYFQGPGDHLKAIDMHYVAYRMRHWLGKNPRTYHPIKESDTVLFPRSHIRNREGALEFAQLMAYANTTRRLIIYWRIKQPYNHTTTEPAEVPEDESKDARFKRANPIPAPRKPRQNGTGLVSCVYCGILLDVAVVRDPAAWRRHVFSDIRPYMCTYPNCKTRDITYPTRREWIAHEQRCHRHYYQCSNCKFRAWEEEDLRVHLREKHPKTESCDLAPCRLVEPWLRECLLCDHKGYLEEMEAHYAVHFEDLALIVVKPSRVVIQAEFPWEPPEK